MDLRLLLEEYSLDETPSLLFSASPQECLPLVQPVQLAPSPPLQSLPQAPAIPSSPQLAGPFPVSLERTGAARKRVFQCPVCSMAFKTKKVTLPHRAVSSHFAEPPRRPGACPSRAEALGRAPLRECLFECPLRGLAPCSAARPFSVRPTPHKHRSRVPHAASASRGRWYVVGPFECSDTVRPGVAVGWRGGRDQARSALSPYAGCPHAECRTGV
ncbi:hypothetical protein BC830DRAFT_65177 [Chytriomyces sp. MP71]|nr:hypothetical protein BC830DRAFT_65177 [Chytriomyces sp. MP71]